MIAENDEFDLNDYGSPLAYGYSPHQFVERIENTSQMLSSLNPSPTNLEEEPQIMEQEEVDSETQPRPKMKKNKLKRPVSDNKKKFKSAKNDDSSSDSEYDEKARKLEIR